jgi:hypothetical protein
MPHKSNDDRNAYLRERYENDPEYRARVIAKTGGHAAEKRRAAGAGANTRRPELAGLEGAEYRKAYYELRKAEIGKRACPRCGEVKPPEEFSARSPHCKPCRSIIESERYEHNKKQMRDRAREREFGLQPGQYQEMLADQGGVCALCEEPETNTYRGLVRALVVDHDHDNGEVRGLLCAKCNTRLHAGVDIEWYTKVIAYLTEWSSP